MAGAASLLASRRNHPWSSHSSILLTLTYQATTAVWSIQPQPHLFPFSSVSSPHIHQFRCCQPTTLPLSSNNATHPQFSPPPPTYLSSAPGHNRHPLPWTRNGRTMCRPRPCRRAFSRRDARLRRSRTGSSGRRMSWPILLVSYNLKYAFPQLPPNNLPSNAPPTVAPRNLNTERGGKRQPPTSNPSRRQCRIVI